MERGYEVRIVAYCTDDGEKLECDDHYPFIQDYETEKEAQAAVNQLLDYYLTPDGIEDIRNTCPEVYDIFGLVVERLEARIRKFEHVALIAA